MTSVRFNPSGSHTEGTDRGHWHQFTPCQSDQDSDDASLPTGTIVPMAPAADPTEGVTDDTEGVDPQSVVSTTYYNPEPAWVPEANDGEQYYNAQWRQQDERVVANEMGKHTWMVRMSWEQWNGFMGGGTL